MENINYCVTCKKEIVENLKCIDGSTLHECIVMSKQAFEIQKQNNENVNHPQHYGGRDNVYEAIKIIRHHRLGFCLGNALKYIIRAGKKDESKYIEDLEKAVWYIQYKINELKNEQQTKN